MGSWVTYGLGTENHDLPGFVVLLSGPNGPDGGTALWSSGFLPSVYQGVQFRSQGDPVLYVSNPPGMDADARRDSLDALRDLNRCTWPTPATRKSPRASSSTNWPTACKPPCRS